MNVDQAKAIAKKYLVESIGIRHTDWVRVEEVVHDPDDGWWEITLQFVRG